tara:strand:- start:1131 stop:1811 length:681 start_codon:yes stop_codon:yes gene_type:complete
MNSLLPEFQAIYLPQEILINLTLAFILGVIVSIIYKKTHKGLSYSQSFMVTNIFVAVIVCMVIMIIGNNLARAFALVGALSIIRFRTVVKDTKDTAFIFWSLAVGMASGTGSYFLAVAGTVMISLIAIILHKTNFGSFVKSEFILQFILDQKDEKVTKKYLEIIKKFTNSYTLLSSENSSDNNKIKLNFDIVMQEEKEQTELLKELSKIKGISEIVIIAAKSDVDY